MNAITQPREAAVLVEIYEVRNLNLIYSCTRDMFTDWDSNYFVKILRFIFRIVNTTKHLTSLIFCGAVQCEKRIRPIFCRAPAPRAADHFSNGNARSARRLCQTGKSYRLRSCLTHIKNRDSPSRSCLHPDSSVYRCTQPLPWSHRHSPQ